MSAIFLHQQPVHAVVLESVPRDDQEVRTALPSEPDDVARGVEPRLANARRRRPRVRSLHADLPVGRVDELHAMMTIRTRGRRVQNKLPGRAPGLARLPK
jgi:hypothetical protein